MIPLEDKGRGENLWLRTGQELGLINDAKQGYNVPSIMIKNITEQPDIKTPKIQFGFQSVIPSIINALQLQPEINTLEMPEIKNVIPHATGGIFSQPHIGLVAEAGREAVIPIPLWRAAGEEMGLRFGSVTNNNDNSSSNSNVTVSPTFNITVNGGDEQSGNKIREIIEDILLEIQNDGMRRSFA